MNGTHSTAAIRPTSGNHQRLLDDEPRTRWPRSGVERAGAWSAGSSDNVDWPDLPCARSVGAMLIWNNLIPAMIDVPTRFRKRGADRLSVSRHSPDELWNGVEIAAGGVPRKSQAGQRFAGVDMLRFEVPWLIVGDALVVTHAVVGVAA